MAKSDCSSPIKRDSADLSQESNSQYHLTKENLWFCLLLTLLINTANCGIVSSTTTLSLSWGNICDLLQKNTQPQVLDFKKNSVCLQIFSNSQWQFKQLVAYLLKQLEWLLKQLPQLFELLGTYSVKISSCFKGGVWHLIANNLHLA